MISSRIRNNAPATESADQQCEERGRIARREQSEADEKRAEPENHHHQERRGNRGSALLEQEPAHLPKIERHRPDLRFKRALRVVLRYQFLDLVEQDLVAGLGGGRGPRLCHFCPKSDRAFLRPHC